MYYPVLPCYDIKLGKINQVNYSEICVSLFSSKHEALENICVYPCLTLITS